MKLSAQPKSLDHWRLSAPAAIAEPLAADIALASSRLESAAQARMVEILAVLTELRADPTTLRCALLSPLLETGKLQLDEVSDADAVLKALITGHQEATRVWALYADKPDKGSAEGIRRLLLVLIRDLRVVFVLLAEQLVRMRHLGREVGEEERRAVAQLTADIHAPLANRLGVWQVKWELEDLAFRHLQPENYKRVADLLDERRGDRERYIRTVINELSEALRSAGIEPDVAGRPKHIFSIWKKMNRKSVDFQELFDVRAVRVLVADVPTCYAALGVVHAKWPYIPKEFDDYIAHPKGNNYRSLHTAVVGPEGKAVEVQIRTREMHEHAELGVAAHWRYKEGGGADAQFERKINHLRDLLEARGEDGGDSCNRIAHCGELTMS
jgi:GTP pyrophosphokinase